MALLLGARLSGPRVYDGVTSNEPWLNETGRTAAAGDIPLALKYYVRAMVLAALGLLIAGGFIWMI